LEEAKEVFDKATEDGGLTVTELPNVLLDFFGVHCVKQLRDLIEVAGDALKYSGTHTCTVCFHEFLVWARHLKNAELLELAEWFEGADDDEDGQISFDQMMHVMKQEGFTLSRTEAQEFLKAADLEEGDDSSYSYDDVYALLGACRESEGFGAKDLEELKAAYERFDTEDEGEITTLQVLDLLRFLGYQLYIQDVETYAKEVDFNGNGTMDVGEYLRLMRLHREDELMAMRISFSRRIDRKSERLPIDCLHDALKESKCCSSHCDVFDELCEGSVDETTVDLSFDEFRALADKGRKAVKRAQRKKANFSDTEFQLLQRAFAEHDTGGQGVLDHPKMLLLLNRCGVPCVDKEGHRLWGVDMLDKARQQALDADMCPDDIGMMGAHSVTFWVMVHVWRMIARDNECKNVARLEEARIASNFSVAEVEEFQKVFSDRISQRCKEESGEESEEEEEEAPVQPARRRSMADLYADSNVSLQSSTVQMLNTAKSEGKVRKSDDQSIQAILGISNATEMLDFQGFKGLLGHLKIRMGPAHVEQLEIEMEDLTGDPEGVLDFVNFLRVMRWMMDTNFAHLNDNTAATAKAAPAVKAAVVRDDDDGFGSDDDEEPISPHNSRGSKLLGRRASV